jgi:hypothetical protein
VVVACQNRFITVHDDDITLGNVVQGAYVRIAEG